MKSPTITDIARLASVSVGTASNVLNGKPIVSEELVDRVGAAAEMLGYSRNAVAAGLRLKHTGVVAFVAPNIENAFFSEVLQEIEHCALEDNRSVLFMTTGEDEERVRRQIQALISRRVDGLIIIPAFDFQPALKELERYQIPIVIADRVSQISPFPSVTADNEGAGYIAGKHLFELGADEVVFLGHAKGEFWILQQREAGFMRAAREFGKADRVRIENISLDIQQGQQQVQEFLSTLVQTPSAIFASSNLAVKSAIPAIQTMKWSIPDSTMLLAMDDFEALWIFDPGISVISQPAREIARQAWNMLLRQLNGEDIEDNRVVLDTKLIVRGSTGKSSSNVEPGSGLWKRVRQS